MDFYSNETLLKWLQAPAQCSEQFFPKTIVVNLA